ncbi:conserved protein of unknown function [Methylorubrum extorquens]|uniref:Uncharacterized protein n=1 Tax=Methylorubrum extorquens TaxID=408 RepID=A0A2N9AR93_METEX|nr:conserved protein of unknown function [Methylorubrum extorquens]
MKVRMLTAMAGDVSYGHGEIVTVEDRVGEAWIKAGIAEVAPTAAASEKAAKDLRARVAELETALADAEADRDALRIQVAALAEQNAALTLGATTGAANA